MWRPFFVLIFWNIDSLESPLQIVVVTPEAMGPSAFLETPTLLKLSCP